MNPLEMMKAELMIMREETICMEAMLIYAENELAEMKRVVSEYKATKKMADDLLDVVLAAEGGDGDNNSNNNNSENILDEETMKRLIEEAMRDLRTEGQTSNVAPQQPRGGSHPSDGENGGEGYDGSTSTTGDENNIDNVKETCGASNAGDKLE